MGESAYERHAASGAHTMDRDFSEADRLYEENQRAKEQAIHEAAARLHEIKEERRFQASLAAAKHEGDLEVQRIAALKRMSAIDMTQPGSVKKMQDIQNELPGAFIGKNSVEGQWKSQVEHAMSHDNARQVKQAAIENADRVRAEKLAESNRLRGEKKADSDTLEIEKKKQADALGLSVSEINAAGGKIYKPEKGKGAANVEKLQSDFEKNENGYHAMQDTIAKTEGAVTPALIERRNFYRNQMLSLGARLSNASPDMAGEIKGKINDAVLSEHNALESEINNKDTDEAKRKKLAAEINPLKKILNFQQIGTDGTTEAPKAATTRTAPRYVPPSKRTAATPLSQNEFGDAPEPPEKAPDAPANPNLPVAPVVAKVAPPDSEDTQSAPAPVEPHPYEGKRVLQKSTGKYGVFKDGQFIPE